MPTEHIEGETAVMPEDEWEQVCRLHNHSRAGSYKPGGFEPVAHAQVCLFGSIVLHAWRKS